MKKTIASADFSSQRPLESLIQENISSIYICNIANCLIFHHCIFNRLVTLLEKNLKFILPKKISSLNLSRDKRLHLAKMSS